MERAIFEAALFNVVPVVAVNGQAQDTADMPILEVGSTSGAVTIVTPSATAVLSEPANTAPATPPAEWRMDMQCR